MHIKDRMTAFLLHNAGPSIRLRIRREIVGDSTPAEESTLLTEIMAEPVYGLIAACQKENGWLGNGFHGPNKNAGPYENQEVGTKYLAEKGFGKENPVLQGAMNAFVTVPLSDPFYRTRGKVYDEFKYAANGQNLIRCACIARAGFDDVIDIEPQIRLSLESFRRVLEVDSIMEISRTVESSKYRLFNNFEKWPCRYHFDILAHTESWKTPEACRMLADAFAALMRTDRPELIGVGAASWAGHVLGTLGCYTEGFSTRCVKDGWKRWNGCAAAACIHICRYCGKKWGFCWILWMRTESAGRRWMKTGFTASPHTADSSLKRTGKHLSGNPVTSHSAPCCAVTAPVCCDCRITDHTTSVYADFLLFCEKHLTAVIFCIQPNVSASTWILMRKTHEYKRI